MTIPRDVQWLFWEVDPHELSLPRDADYIIPRVLEHGGLAEVRWLIAASGLARIHRFLRDVGHPELSDKTITFWRAALNAENEKWVARSDWRKSKSAPWIA